MGRRPKPLESWWPSLSALFTLLIGLGLVTMGYFRFGLLVIAAAAVVALVLRFRLSDSAAGMLVVRSRKADVLALSVLSVGLVALAIWVPAPR